MTARRFTRENRERLSSMTDDELLAYMRERHGNPYMNLTTAKELRKTSLKFWHLGEAIERAEQKAREDSRRALREKLWPRPTDSG